MFNPGFNQFSHDGLFSILGVKLKLTYFSFKASILELYEIVCALKGLPQEKFQV
ncbi:hypothetical protein SOVF_107970 isoform B [Spinacia oleracea]|nr:hypothetical protein SOVF_107970 isoform B [Spinacia oleracea]